MSDWKMGAAARRDERHTKTEAQVPAPRNSKNKRRWCKGKFGIEHKTECQPYAAPGYQQSYMRDAFKQWRSLVCTVCSKRLETYSGHGGKPDWVTS